MRSRIRGSSTILSSLLVLLLAGVAACGGAANSATDTGGSADPTARLRFAAQSGVDTWDPVASTGGSAIAVQGLIFDTLVHTTPEGTAEPGMAESWTYNQDGTSLDLQLREGITFTDGTPFDATAAKANLDRARGEESKIRQDFVTVADVQVVDPRTVRITFDQPNADFALLLSDRGGMMLSPASLTGDPGRNPVGSGQFVLTSDQPGVAATFDRNPAYWEPDAVKVAGLDMQVMSDSQTRINALSSGSLDVAELDPAQIPQAEGYGVQVLTAPDIRFYSLNLNPVVEPALADPRVRLAITLGIDRDGIIQGIMGGLGAPMEQPFPTTSPNYNPAIRGAWNHDPQRARQLLTEAGVTDLQLTVVTSQDAVGNQIAQAIQAQLKEVGVTVEIKPLAGFGAADAFFTNKTEPAMFLRSRSHIAPTQAVAKFYSAGVQANPGDVTDPVVDDLLDQARAETDDAKRAELINQITARLVESPGPVLPIVEVTTALGAGADVVGLTPYFSGYPNFTSTGIAAGD